VRTTARVNDMRGANSLFRQSSLWAADPITRRQRPGRRLTNTRWVDGCRNVGSDSSVPSREQCRPSFLLVVLDPRCKMASPGQEDDMRGWRREKRGGVRLGKDEGDWQLAASSKRVRSLKRQLGWAQMAGRGGPKLVGFPETKATGADHSAPGHAAIGWPQVLALARSSQPDQTKSQTPSSQRRHRGSGFSSVWCDCLVLSRVSSCRLHCFYVRLPTMQSRDDPSCSTLCRAGSTTS